MSLCSEYIIYDDDGCAAIFYKQLCVPVSLCSEYIIYDDDGCAAICHSERSEDELLRTLSEKSDYVRL